MVYYDSQIITSQVVLSAIVVNIFRIIKKSKLIPWINGNTKILNKIIAVAASGLVALGINWNYSYTPDNDGTIAIMITGVSLAGLYSMAKTWVFSYIVQQSGYRMTEKPVPLSNGVLDSIIRGDK